MHSLRGHLVKCVQSSFSVYNASFKVVDETFKTLEQIGGGFVGLKFDL